MSRALPSSKPALLQRTASSSSSSSSASRSPGFAASNSTPSVGSTVKATVQSTQSRVGADRYVRQERVGRGSFGTVYKGYDVHSGEVVAIKASGGRPRFRLSVAGHRSRSGRGRGRRHRAGPGRCRRGLSDAMQEIAILSRLDSPWVTKMHGSFLRGTELWIVMQFCSGGSCADLVRRPC